MPIAASIHGALQRLRPDTPLFKSSRVNIINKVLRAEAAALLAFSPKQTLVTRMLNCDDLPIGPPVSHEGLIRRGKMQ